MHADCTVGEILDKGSKALAKKIGEIRSVLDQGVDGPRRDKALKEMDGIVGAECPKCR